MQNQLKQLKRKLNSSELLEELLRLLSLAKDKPFLVAHCIRVGEILAQMNCSKETVIASMLYQSDQEKFDLKNLSLIQNKEVGHIVTKAKRLQETYGNLKDLKTKPIKDWQKALLDQQAENLRKSFFGLTKDLRPILVLIACKLDELTHLVCHYSNDQQKKQAVFALEIMAPLCYGLGMEKIKAQFEDLAFPIIYPKEYKWLVDNLSDDYERVKAYTEKIKPQIINILKERDVKPVEISSRAKHFFSLFQKLLRHDMDISKIYDLVAVRIIVKTVEECYRALGILHKNFKPIEGRVKDYIVKPKENGYRAIHTTITGPENRIIEIQIKTVEMHKEAEFGIAAHLSYKGNFSSKTYKYQFYWLDQLRQWKAESQNIENVSKYIQTELFRNRIFALTPKGDLIDLPKGATPVDFAYAIHSDVGEHTAGVKVNGKMVPLETTLRNNDKVEIIVEKHKTPSAKWLRFVKTAKAKAKISKFIEQTYGSPPESPVKAAVSAIKKIIPRQLPFSKKPKILIAGETGIAFKIAKCCQPKAKDKILAFIDRGEGASIHKETCHNLIELKQKWPERIVSAQWI